MPQSSTRIEADFRSNSTQETQLTREEVAKHNTPESSWIIINSYVYDITNFAELHVIIFLFLLT